VLFFFFSVFRRKYFSTTCIEKQCNQLLILVTNITVL